MKALFKILLVSSLVYPALISGAASKSGYTENLVVEEIEMDTIEIDSIDYDAIEIDGDSVEALEVAEEIIEEYHDFAKMSSRDWYEDKGNPYPLQNFEDDFKAGNYKKILKDAEKVLADYPEASDGKFFEAYAYYLLKDYKRAGELATDLAASYPSDSNTSNLLNAICKKDPQSFFLAAKKFLQKDASDYYTCLDFIEVLNLMSYLSSECGYLLNALDYLDQLESELNSLDEELIDDCFIDSYNVDLRRASLYMSMGEYETALKHLDSMEEWERDKSWYNNKVGSLRGAYGLESSLEFAKATLEEYPGSTFLGVLYMADLTLAGEFDQAIEEADSLIVSKFTYPDELPELYFRRGLAKRLSGNKEGAEKDFIKVVELCEDDGYGPVIYAKCYLGRTDEVLSHIDEYEEYFQASVYNVLGMTEKALEKLGEAYEKCQWNPTRTKYDIFQRSLVSHPSFAKIAEKFQPKKRRF